MRRPHDMGGLEAGPIDPEEHPSEPWEKRVRVMRQLLSRQRPPVMTVDELRRGIEDLGAEDYHRLRYYERWTAAIANILIQKGVVSIEELGRQMAEVTTRWQKDREP
jgi:Nitrile hydratase beta subunit